jgi:hypothetical protein
MDSIKRTIRDDLDRLIPGGLTVDVLVEVRDFVSDKTGEFNGPVYSDAGPDNG